MKKFHVLPVVLFFFFMAACSLMKAGYVIPDQHPEELGRGNPLCTDCHDPKGEHVPFKRFNHTVFFMKNHRLQASQAPRICIMCHRESFCNDCHATNVELKPSIKNQTDTYRRMPHRGDYLSRHQIDGRVDPTSCRRCHGNPKTNKRCAPCHG